MYIFKRLNDEKERSLEVVVSESVTKIFISVQKNIDAQKICRIHKTIVIHF